eukprot:3934372-Rhodomonas_salina.4
MPDGLPSAFLPRSQRKLGQGGEGVSGRLSGSDVLGGGAERRFVREWGVRGAGRGRESEGAALT